MQYIISVLRSEGVREVFVYPEVLIKRKVWELDSRTGLVYIEQHKIVNTH